MFSVDSTEYEIEQYLCSSGCGFGSAKSDSIATTCSGVTTMAIQHVSNTKESKSYIPRGIVISTAPQTSHPRNGGRMCNKVVVHFVPSLHLLAIIIHNHTEMINFYVNICAQRGTSKLLLEKENL